MATKVLQSNNTAHKVAARLWNVKKKKKDGANNTVRKGKRGVEKSRKRGGVKKYGEHGKPARVAVF